MKTLYLVLVFKDDFWETVLRTYSKQEAVATHRKLTKQGHNAIIDYEEN